MSDPSAPDVADRDDRRAGIAAVDAPDVEGDDATVASGDTPDGAEGEPEPERRAGREADGDDGKAGDPGAAAGSSRRWMRIAGAVGVAYVCWYVLGLVVLEASPSGYNSMNGFYASLPFRVVLCVVALALIVHLVDGVRFTLVDLWPRLVGRDAGLRAAARFVICASWIPAALVLLWPAVRGWFAR